MNERKRWIVVVVFATAMAWVESAVVYYLRTMIHRIEPYQATPLPIFGGLGFAELVRELATLIMLATVGMLAGKNAKSRMGYFVIAFGVWDIFYYVFLKILTDWPHSLGDWDILFLLPLPWWGPVWAPVCISLLMIFWGTMASQFELKSNVTWRSWAAAGMGTLLALYIFMADALQAARAGESLREMLPVSFHGALFSLALLLMAFPVFADTAVILKKRFAVPLKIWREV